MIELPDGRVLLIHWISDLDEDTANLRVHFSDDEGASWETYAAFAAQESVGISGVAADWEIGRLSAGYLNGQILLMAELRTNGTVAADHHHRDVFRQFASDDLGNTFDTVNTWTTDDPDAAGPDADQTVGGRFPNVIVWKNQFVFVYVSYNGAIGNGAAPRVFFSSNAYEDLELQIPTVWGEDNAVWSEKNGTTLLGPEWAITTAGVNGTETLSDGDCTAWIDDDDIIYCAGRLTSDDGACVVTRSIDGGKSWDPLGQSGLGSEDFGNWYYPKVPNHAFPRAFQGASQGGRHIIVGNFDTAVGAFGPYSLIAYYLGGYATVTTPGMTDRPQDIQRIAWETTWLPFDLPDDAEWATAGPGTAALSGTNLKMSISTVANQKSFSIVPTGTADTEGLIARWSMQCTIGGSLTGNDVALRVILNNGATDTSVTVRFTTTSFRLLDDSISAIIGDVTGLTLSNRHDFLLAVKEGEVAMWYREGGPEEDREFIEGPSGSLDTAAIAGAHEFEFGHIGVGSASSFWHEMFCTYDEWSGNQISQGPANPQQLFGRPYSANPIWVDGGTRLATVDGPTRVAEEQDIDTRYDYSIDFARPAVSPSPRKTWRSSDETEQLIAYRLNDFAADAQLLNDSIGLYLGNINWKDGELQGFITGAGWSTIFAIDSATDRSSLPYVRAGNTIIPSSAAHTAEHYIAYNELAGSTVDLGSGKIRKILRNTEGYWTNVATKKPTLYLDGMDDTEPASGTCDIWIKELAIYHHHTFDEYQGYRIVVDAQTTSEGYFQIGSFVLGPLVIMGTPYAHGRGIDSESNTLLTTFEDGSRRSRNLGPMRRSVDFTWEELDASAVFATTDDHVFATDSASRRPVALLRDTPMLMQGVVEYLNGSDIPVVYLAEVAKGTPDTVHLVSKREHLYGRVMSDVNITASLGEENDTEVYRTARIVIEEEV
jgi:hypothetical protein